MDDQGKPERKLEGDDVVGEREEKGRKPSCHSVFSDDDSDTEEEEVKNGSDNKLMPPSSRFVSKSVNDFDSDDDFVVDRAPCSGVDFQKPLDPEAAKKYYQQIGESEGFDISYFPGPSMWTPIAPVKNIKQYPSDYEDVVNHAKLAINKYNIEHDEAYEFVDLETVNTRVVAGIIYYITFQVKNLKAAAGNGNGNVDGDDTPLETFQARVWEGIEKTEVQLCRPKPIKPQN